MEGLFFLSSASVWFRDNRVIYQEAPTLATSVGFDKKNNTLVIKLNVFRYCDRK